MSKKEYFTSYLQERGNGKGERERDRERAKQEEINLGFLRCKRLRKRGQIKFYVRVRVMGKLRHTVGREWGGDKGKYQEKVRENWDKT